MTCSLPYLEGFMTASTKLFCTTARCLLVSVAMAVLGFTSGCGGGVAPQATLDDAAKARVQEAREVQHKLIEKRAAKAPRGKSGRLSKGDLEN
jgi:hypothetical protein